MIKNSTYVTENRLCFTKRVCLPYELYETHKEHAAIPNVILLFHSYWIDFD